MRAGLRIFLFIASVLPGFAADYPFNWTTRTDRDGKVAGYYATTPFPLNESITSYTNTTDEGSTIYSLGTLYFVDGARADDTGDGTSLATAKKTIAAGITAAGAGNKTVLIRGAHDAFSGAYAISSALVPLSGTANTTRWTLAGYGQERPAITNATLTDTTDLLSVGSSKTWITLQRLKIADTTGNGIRLDQCSNINLIDLWLTNCIGTTNGGGAADGLLYLVGSSNTYISHVTTEHGYGHAMKLSDSSDVLVEWSLAKEFGYWANITNESTGLAIAWRHSAGYDFRNTVVSTNATIRYSIAHTGKGQCLQFDMNNGGNCLAHHNEFYNGVPSTALLPWNTNVDKAVVLMKESKNVIIRENIIRDALDSAARELWVWDTGPSTVTAWNNLIRGTAVAIQNQGILTLLNSTILETNASSAAIIDFSGTSLSLTNNIIIQGGAANCVNIGTATHDYNRFWPAGGGAVGAALVGSDSSGDPLLSGYQLAEGSPCIGVALPIVDFTADINGIARGAAWDIGAYEYVAPATTHLRVTGAARVGILRLR